MPDVLLDGTATGSSTAAGAIITDVALSGASAGVAAPAGNIVRDRGLTGLAAGDSVTYGIPFVALYQSSRPVLRFKPNWRATLRHRYQYELNQHFLAFSSPRFEQLQSDTIHAMDWEILLDADQEEFDHFTWQLKGRANGFWIAAPFEQIEILNGVGADSFHIRDQSLRDWVADHPARFLLFEKDGRRQIGKIDTVTRTLDGRELVALEDPLGTAVDETWESRKLLYVRLASDDEESSFLTDGLQLRKLRVVELPSEYAAIETGQLPVFLYEFSMDTDGAPAIWRFTGLNVEVTSSGDTFTSSPIEHSNWVQSLKAENESLTLDSIHDATNPISRFIPMSLARPLNVTIWEIDYTAPNSRTQVFSGRVLTVEPDGKLLRARCASLLDVQGRRFPKFIVGPRCNYSVYSTPCGIDRTLHMANVVLDDLQGRAVTVFQSTPDDPDHFSGAGAGVFALGYLETGTGPTYEIRSILTSSISSGGYMDLTLHQPLAYAVEAQTAKIYLGCSGSIPDCKTKFNNFDRWGGHPVVPATNPSVRAMEASTANGNKK